MNAEEATEVSFIVRICSTNGYSFDYAKAITSVTSSALGVANSVTVHSGTVDTVGWYTDTASAIEIATISLLLLSLFPSFPLRLFPKTDKRGMK